MSTGIEDLVKTDPASDQEDDPFEIPAFLRRRPKPSPVVEAQTLGGEREDLTGGLVRPRELPPTEIAGEIPEPIVVAGADIGNEAIINRCGSDTYIDGIGTSPGEDAGARRDPGSVPSIAESGARDPRGDDGDEPPSSSTDDEEPTQNNESQKSDPWEPILPVPDGVSVVIPPHRHGVPVASWPYYDAKNRLLLLTCRFDLGFKKNGKRAKAVLPLTYCRSTATGGHSWLWKAPPAPRPLLGLDRLAARPNAPVIVVEGEKVCEPAERRFPDHVAVTSIGGAGNAQYTDWSPLKERDVGIWRDADLSGRDHADDVKRLALEAGAREVGVVQIPASFTDGWDLAEPLPPGVAVEDLRKMLDEAAPLDSDDAEESRKRTLVAVDIEEFLSLDIPPREMLLAPILPEAGLLLLHAWRGVGKTHVALGMAYAVASGGSFLKWKAPKPQKVLYLDGEMPAKEMQEWVAAAVESSDTKPPTPNYLRIITGDLQHLGTSMPDLMTEEGRATVEEWLEGVKLLVIDNISCLVRSGKENEADAWEPMQTWLLNLRHRGIAVVLVHHDGNNGDQRGASKREDPLDTTIQLRHPSDYQPTEGARFVLHISKGRGIFGEAAKDFEARLETRDGTSFWTTRDIEDVKTVQAEALLAEGGLSIRDVADEVGLSKSVVGRIRKRMKEGVQ